MLSLVLALLLLVLVLRAKMTKLTVTNNCIHLSAIIKGSQSYCFYSNAMEQHHRLDERYLKRANAANQ